jgi:hypothetical protein
VTRTVADPVIALLPAILAHAVLGLFLALVIWGSGCGWLAAVVARGRESAEIGSVHAYPVGLASVLVTCALLLSGGGARLAGLVLALVPVWGLVRRRQALGRAGRQAVRATLAVVVPGLGLGGALGLLQHGPTAQLAADPDGDLVFYVALLHGVEQGLFPVRNLALEGQWYGHGNSGPAILGAVLSEIPGFDAFLFHAVALPVHLVVSLAIGLAWLEAGDGSPRGGWRIVALPLLVLGSVWYPSWIVESPPMTLAWPLAFSVCELGRNRRPGAGQLGAVGGLLVFCTSVTKVFASVVVFAVLTVSAAAYLRSGPRARLAVVGTAIAVTGGYVAYMLVRYRWLAQGLSPEFMPLRVIVQGSVAGAITIAGQGLLLWYVWRSRERWLAAGVSAGIGAYWIWPSVAHTATSFALMVTGAAVATRRDEPGAGKWGILAAGSLLALASLMRDPPRYSYRFAVAVGLGLVLALSIACALRAGGSARIGRRWAMVPAQVVALGFIGLAAAVLGVARDADLRGKHGPLTPDDHDVWARVADRTPVDGLIFTTLTGTTVSLKRGWHHYPGVAGRQVFIAGWYGSALAQTDPAAVSRRLDENQAVLEGARSPESLRLSRRYSAYFAVVERSCAKCTGCRRVHENASYIVYRLCS